MADEKTALDLAWDEMAELVRECQDAGLTFSQYVKQLEQQADAAARKLEVARAAAGLCEATKLRKPRADRGKPRKRKADTGSSTESGAAAVRPASPCSAEPPAA